MRKFFLTVSGLLLLIGIVSIGVGFWQITSIFNFRQEAIIETANVVPTDNEILSISPVGFNGEESGEKKCSILVSGKF